MSACSSPYILRLNPGAYLRDSSRFPRRRPLIYVNRHTPSSQSRVYRVTQLRTDGVHCRDSAGTGPVNLKVAPNGCCLGRSSWTKLYAPLSHTPCWYEVGMLKLPASSHSDTELVAGRRSLTAVSHFLRYLEAK